ncbi:IS91 family transposase [Aromatoleum anaerobium]|uniref:IS91 family transposase n=1 Tax=Aromatoleum anaerobium TaxID=182180 RepID=A0ABX1PP60_9RHOO|nr:IS91 family transposase [Aromatoleum anaerobium]MCK0505307.1 IS91 family transposase [Aromatoleum anaerobium]
MRPAGLAEVLDAFGPAYLATRPLPRGGAKVWRAICVCRTAALGGHLEACDACGQRRHVYHSCRNRHCPQCQTRAKEAWLAARRREVLPVPYFHLVFTLPHALNGLIAARPRALYELLFASVAATLTEFAASARHLGGRPAFSLVLHTWTQDLRRHVHVHALVAGGALTADGAWIRPKKGFLFPVRALSRVFRGKFVAGLDGLRQGGRWPAGADWTHLKARLYAHDWVVYAKQPLGGPEAVLEYLGRYTHRVAISNERIVGIDGDEVAFRVRADAGSGKKRTLRLPGGEFIERFLLHVLPPGFKRIRHYGLLSPACKRSGLAAARTALDVPAPSPIAAESVADFLRRVARIEHERCPCCSSGQMHVVAVIPPAPRALHLRGPP